MTATPENPGRPRGWKGSPLQVYLEPPLRDDWDTFCRKMDCDKSVLARIAFKRLIRHCSVVRPIRVLVDRREACGQERILALHALVYQRLGVMQGALLASPKGESLQEAYARLSVAAEIRKFREECRAHILLLAKTHTRPTPDPEDGADESVAQATTDPDTGGTCPKPGSPVALSTGDAEMAEGQT